MFLFENEGCQDTILPLYTAFQSDPPSKKVPCPKVLWGVIKRTYSELGLDVELSDVSAPDIQPASQRRDGEVLIGYSGGKDSLAAVIRCMEMGRKPVLFHVTNVNPINPTECEMAEEMASILDLELIIRPGPIGKRAFPDNPMKNMLIVAMMVDYGMEHGIRSFSEGLHSSHLMSGQNIKYNWSCAREMIDAGSDWFSMIYPAYEWFWILTHDATESLKIVCDFDFELLKSTVSCVHPYRFREFRRKGIIKKYAVDIFPNRCGVCWKCASEYMTLSCLGLVDFNHEYLLYCYNAYRNGLIVNCNVEDANRAYERNDPEEIVGLAINKQFADTSRLLEMLLESV